MELEIDLTNFQKLKSVTATGVLGEFNYDVRFGGDSDAERMRLIYAENGRGKTNFLKAVAAALNDSPESLLTLTDLPVRELDIRFVDGASIRVERADAFDPAFRATATPIDPARAESLDVDPADFAARLSRRAWASRRDFSAWSRIVAEISPGAIFIGDDRLVPSFEDGDPARGAAYERTQARRATGAVERTLAAVERMLTQRAIASLASERRGEEGVYARLARTTLEGAASLKVGEARAALETQISTLLSRGTPLERYGLLSLGQVRAVDAHLKTARANAKGLPALHSILTPYLDSIERQVDGLEETHELIDTFVTAVNSFLDRKRLSFVSSKGIALIGRNGTQLQPESLSSGERHLLYLLSRAILSGQRGEVLVVDEPELSLGIEWQRRLLPELLRCSTHSRSQFMIASHSLQVLGSVARDEVVRPSEAP